MITRLSLDGYMTRSAGSFAGRGAVVVEVITPAIIHGGVLGWALPYRRPLPRTIELVLRAEWGLEFEAYAFLTIEHKQIEPAELVAVSAVEEQFTVPPRIRIRGRVRTAKAEARFGLSCSAEVYGEVYGATHSVSVEAEYGLSCSAEVYGTKHAPHSVSAEAEAVFDLIAAAEGTIEPELVAPGLLVALVAAMDDSRGRRVWR